ncbi:MAG: lysophospholipase [Filifactoraceae bacterium]
MRISERIFKSKSDGLDITFYTFEPETDAKAVIQMTHGMCEHSKRYFWVIEQLVDQGYGVYIHDHRGHGKSKGEKYGHLGNGDIYGMMIRDMRSVNRIIENEHPKSKIIILGHSMGSFLVQRYIQIYPDTVSAVILSGSGGRDQIIPNKMAKNIAKINMKIKGTKTYDKSIEALLMLNFNKRIKKGKTPVDWLTTDEEQIKMYLKDESVGFPFSTSSYYFLFKGISENFHKENLKRIDISMPFLLFSGNDDPVGNYGKGVLDLVKMYKELGISNITVNLYKGKRHEMLNETNRQEVLENILAWLKSIVY